MAEVKKVEDPLKLKEDLFTDKVLDNLIKRGGASDANKEVVDVT